MPFSYWLANPKIGYALLLFIFHYYFLFRIGASYGSEFWQTNRVDPRLSTERVNSSIIAYAILLLAGKPKKNRLCIASFLSLLLLFFKFPIGACYGSEFWQLLVPSHIVSIPIPTQDFSATDVLRCVDRFIAF